MHVFKVGDKARVKYTRAGYSDAWTAGAIVTIADVTIKINPDDDDVCDCLVVCSDGYDAYPLFDQLEPIIEDLSTWEEIQQITNWNPIKEKVSE